MKTRWLAAILATSAACTGDMPDSTPAAAEATAYRVQRTELAVDGVPYLLQGSLGVAAAPINELKDVDAALSAAMIEIGRSIQVPANQLFAKRVELDDIGMTHVRYEQRANGLPVVGGQVIVHLGNDGAIRSVTNAARDASTMPTNPQIDAIVAVERAKASTPNAQTAGAADLVYVITNGDGNLAFAWRTDVRGPLLHDVVFVDAISGEVVARHARVFPIKNRTIYSGFDVATGTGAQTVVGTEGNPPTDANAKFAYDNTGTTYDCYQTLFNRDSYDNAGAALQSLVHVTQNGGAYLNAAWVDEASLMIYGDGNGTQFGPFPKALDVTAHELTHAVTSRSSNLAYQFESGALNEASSDILGVTCESFKAGAVNANTWLVGEDIYTPATVGDALRYMNDPPKDASIYGNDGFTYSRDYYPDRMKFNTTNPQQAFDQGGVHFNSGIANLYFHLLVQGGKHPRNKTPYQVTGIGIDKASKIWYRALTMYMTENETFAQARTHTEMAAQDLFPTNKAAVSLAWAAVGVGPLPPVDNVAPTISITSPVDGTTIPNTVTITVDASDDKGITRIDYSIDGTVVGSATEAPYSFTTPMPIAAGGHLIVATAYDTQNMATDQAAVNLFDPTCGNTCTEDEKCNADNGVCEPKDSGGCCSTSRGNPVSALSLFFATALMIFRRRRNRR